MKMVTTMAEHPSLDVSMPIVYMMSKLFADWQSETRDLLMTVMGPCMKLCAERLMRYDLFSEDSQDPSVIYATYDNEDYPERHAMIGNYRKYCKNTIECIGQRMPYEASEYVIALFETFLQTNDLSNAAPEGMSLNHA